LAPECILFSTEFLSSLTDYRHLLFDGLALFAGLIIPTSGIAVAPPSKLCAGRQRQVAFWASMQITLLAPETQFRFQAFLMKPERIWEAVRLTRIAMEMQESQINSPVLK
jgi:hypothetical protein